MTDRIAVSQQPGSVRLKRLLRRALPRPVARAAYLKALFENEIEFRLLPSLCDRRRTAIDVGAFTGLYTIGVWSHSKAVIAVEPQPGQAAELRRWVPAGVDVIEAALSNQAGEGLLEMEDAAGGSMSRVTTASNARSGLITRRVKLLRLDDLVNAPVGFVKIDAEGHECEVLEGAARMVQRDRPNFVIEAEERYRNGAVCAVINYFRAFDYSGLFVYRGELRIIAQFDAARHQDIALLNGGPRCASADYINNFIFVPRERAAALPARVPSAWHAVVETLGAWARKRGLAANAEPN